MARSFDVLATADVHRRPSPRSPNPALAGANCATEALDLVIPVLNEEARIGHTLEVLDEVIRERGLPIRIIVVDNGCVDRTVDVVSTFATRMPLSVERCTVRGKGAAVRVGISVASAPYVGYCDADLPVPPEALQWAHDLLQVGWEAVVGSRRCAGARYVVPQGRLRRLGGAAFRMVSAGLRGRVSDSQCGFKFFHTALAKQLVADATIDGFAFDVEIVARVQRTGARLIEMPLPWSDGDGSSFRSVTDGIRSFVDLWPARRNLRSWAPAAVGE